LSLAPFPVQVAPVVANGLVFTADGGCHSDTCNLVARDARTGALLWSSPFLDELHWQSPILVDGALYITDSNGLMWKFGLPDNDAIFGDGFDGG
jgi:outer membrane protein assembly factor BamB